MNINFGKKTGALCLAFALAVGSLPVTAQAARNTDPWSCTQRGNYAPQPASIIIDTATGHVLHSENADEKRHPASLVKMMTAMMIFEAIESGKLSLNDIFKAKISPDVLKTRKNSRSTWVKAGTQLSVEEAILAISVASANNISVMMAEKLAGSEQAFVDQLNKKAQSVGLTSTTFKNATGLPDPDQITTARDMVTLSLFLMKNYPQYYHYFSAETAEFGDWKGKKKKHNHNELIVNNNDIDGIKTGFICDSGYNMAASSERNGHRITGVVFGERTPHTRNVKMKALLNDAFKSYKIAKQQQEQHPLVTSKPS